MGLAVGTVFGLMGLLEAPIDITTAVSPSGLLASSRDNVVFHLLVWALVMGPEVGLVAGLTGGPGRGLEVGLVFGIEAAFGIGLGYGLGLTAWGQWVALSRIWLYQCRHARLQEHLSPAREL